ncbi:hypothetical protein AMECASPLE_028076 [Ameca splendens]|uniref:Uncharacterized protein n=1 Tax=Ameca splendens TaxID=208324 RepID=A0ABV0YSE8_9TELE
MALWSKSSPASFCLSRYEPPLRCPSRQAGNGNETASQPVYAPSDVRAATPAKANCVPEFPEETLSIQSRVEQFFPGLKGQQQEPHPVVTCSWLADTASRLSPFVHRAAAPSTPDPHPQLRDGVEPGGEVTGVLHSLDYLLRSILEGGCQQLTARVLSLSGLPEPDLVFSYGTLPGSTTSGKKLSSSMNKDSNLLDLTVVSRVNNYLVCPLLTLWQIIPSTHWFPVSSLPAHVTAL